RTAAERRPRASRSSAPARRRREPRDGACPRGQASHRGQVAKDMSRKTSRQRRVALVPGLDADLDLPLAVSGVGDLHLRVAVQAALLELREDPGAGGLGVVLVEQLEVEQLDAEATAEGAVDRADERVDAAARGRERGERLD